MDFVEISAHAPSRLTESVLYNIRPVGSAPKLLTTRKYGVAINGMYTMAVSTVSIVCRNQDSADRRGNGSRIIGVILPRCIGSNHNSSVVSSNHAA